jgi:hypothetical protein
MSFPFAGLHSWAFGLFARIDRAEVFQVPRIRASGAYVEYPRARLREMPDIAILAESF